jgi:Dockerin type I domain
MLKIISISALFILQVSLLQSQNDTTPPVLQCATPSVVQVDGNTETLWPADFIESVSDDQTNSHAIQLAVRKQCTGAGFPEANPTVEVGWDKDVRLEIWARDAAGNTSSCQVQVAVEYSGAVPKMEFIATGYLPGSVQSSVFESTIYQVSGYNCAGDSIAFGTESTSIVASDFGLRAGFSLEIRPSKLDNPLNGVTTYDLVLIHKHILGIELLDSPYKLLAADANADGKVSLADILVLRQLIYGIYNELPDSPSWRFVPADFIFSNPADPFQEPIPDRILVPADIDPVLESSPYKFIGVKVGDVNNSSIQNN